MIWEEKIQSKFNEMVVRLKYACMIKYKMVKK